MSLSNRYPLSKSQRLIYEMEKFVGGTVSVICGSMISKGERNLSDIKSAAKRVLERNDALRICIHEVNGAVTQSVTECTNQDVEVLRFENKTQLDDYAQHYAQIPLDIHGTLCEMKVVILPGHYGLLVKLHHLIGDAWTLALMGNQFNALLNGSEPAAYSYVDHIESEQIYLKSSRYSKDRDFFLKQFQKCDEATCLSEKQNRSYAAARKTFVIDDAGANQITNYAAFKGISAFMLFIAALAVYMNRTKMNAEKFYIGTAVLNRRGAKEKNTAGMFVNTVPLLIELDNTKSFADNLEAIKQSVLSVFRHQKFHYGDTLAAIRNTFGFDEKLYDVMLSYQNAAITGEGFETTWYHSGMQSESLQIHIDDRDNEGIFRIHFDYQTGKFTEHEIDVLHEHLCNLLFDSVKNDTKKLYELEFLTADEKQKLLFDFNDTAADYPKDKCVHQLFEEQVQKTPDKTAAIAGDKTLTYAELNEQANRIAHSLIEKGVGVGDIVAFVLPRKSHLIATMFGILKTGAAYLPVDPDYPQDRIDYMLSDSKAKLCVEENDVVELLENRNTANPNVSVSSESLCYCIYTSGSTGKPKGTMLKHRGLVNLVTNLNIYADISGCERFGFMTTVSFDVATQEIFTALLNGFTGVLMPERKMTSVEEIVDGIIANKIDVMYATPTYFDSLTSTEDKADRLLSAVKVVCLAGEKFSLNNHVLALKNRYHVIFENQYGPAETHVISTSVMIG